MSKAAFIGLGAMGARMATNLLKAGHEVTVCDLAPEAVDKLTCAGAKTAPSAREAAEGNDFVLTMVRDDNISRKVWLDETTGALAGMKPGAVAIECSTITPAWAHELGGAISKAGIAMLEAPVSGSTPQAENAQLVFLIGGHGETLKRAEPLLKGMGSSVRYAGPEGPHLHGKDGRRGRIGTDRQRSTGCFPEGHGRKARRPRYDSRRQAVLKERLTFSPSLVGQEVQRSAPAGDRQSVRPTSPDPVQLRVSSAA